MEQTINPWLCYVVSLVCNLRCKLCQVRSPYYKKPYNPSLTVIKQQLDEYFKIFDYTGKFDLSGGEPLIRKDLHEILDHMLQYRDKIGRLRIVTNGTIVPSDDICKALQRMGGDTDVLVDRYDCSDKVDFICSKLSAYGITAIVRNYAQFTTDAIYCKGWFEYISSNNEFNQSKDCDLLSRLPSLFAVHGRLFRCCIQPQYYDFFAPTTRIGGVLLVDDGKALKKKKEDALALLQSRTLDACSMCNGRNSSSKRSVPAEQLTDKELVEWQNEHPERRSTND